MMGTRGIGSLGNLFLGSVAAQVVKLAQVLVILVKMKSSRGGPICNLTLW
jgi:nucleotide-binding universal stress UspA family protein